MAKIMFFNKKSRTQVLNHRLLRIVDIKKSDGIIWLRSYFLTGTMNLKF